MTGLRGRLAEVRDRVWTMRLVRRTEAAMVPPPPWDFAACGDDTIIVPPARIERPDRIVIGRTGLIHEHVWLLARTSGPEPTLRIGDGVVFNRFVKIVALESVTIGDGVILGDRTYVSDVQYEPGHADRLPSDRPLTDPLPVRIEDGAALGVGVVVMPGVTIGERAYIGAGSVVTKDVPARSLAVGNPARVVRRYDPERDSW